jgi:hypothetical protein
MVSPPKLAKKININAIFKMNLFFFNWASQGLNVARGRPKVKVINDLS